MNNIQFAALVDKLIFLTGVITEEKQKDGITYLFDTDVNMAAEFDRVSRDINFVLQTVSTDLQNMVAPKPVLASLSHAIGYPNLTVGDIRKGYAHIVSHSNLAEPLKLKLVDWINHLDEISQISGEVLVKDMIDLDQPPFLQVLQTYYCSLGECIKAFKSGYFSTLLRADLIALFKACGGVSLSQVENVIQNRTLGAMLTCLPELTRYVQVKKCSFVQLVEKIKRIPASELKKEIVFLTKN